MKNITKTYAEVLNKGCSCITLNKDVLQSHLANQTQTPNFVQELMLAHPSIFSSTCVFLSPQHFNAIAEIIFSIEEIIKRPLYQEKVMKRAPSIAHRDFGPKGVLMGYDFHLHNDGPKLIEINTNAGGALLNLELAKAQDLCCRSQEAYLQSITELSKVESLFFEMFMNEWKSQKGDEAINLVAIVDDDPKNQYLYCEFQLFQHFFSKHNVSSVIVDACELEWKNGKLCYGDRRIDFVYNRLTDFYLEEESHAALRLAYESGSTVVTPSPHHHALHAHKLNLVLLSNKEELVKLNPPSSIQEILLQGIPQTQEVIAANDSKLWEMRKDLFFKPDSGFGSKAAYRGDKITKKVWQHIMQGGYVAQKFSPPGERFVKVDNKETSLRLDIRAYVYAGKIQLMAARLYSGQTTNFRTAGGGFAPVFIVPDAL